jgi:hypothetical protein
MLLEECAVVLKPDKYTQFVEENVSSLVEVATTTHIIVITLETHAMKKIFSQVLEKLHLFKSNAIKRSLFPSIIIIKN